MSPHNLKPGDTVRILNDESTRNWSRRFLRLIGGTFTTHSVHDSGSVSIIIPDGHPDRDQLPSVVFTHAQHLEKVNKPRLTHLE